MDIIKLKLLIEIKRLVDRNLSIPAYLMIDDREVYLVGYETYKNDMHNRFKLTYDVYRANASVSNVEYEYNILTRTVKEII